MAGLGVAGLVRQREAGTLSRGEFFARLAALQAASHDAPGSRAQASDSMAMGSWPGGGCEGVRRDVDMGPLGIDTMRDGLESSCSATSTAVSTPRGGEVDGEAIGQLGTAVSEPFTAPQVPPWPGRRRDALRGGDALAADVPFTGAWPTCVPDDALASSALPFSVHRAPSPDGHAANRHHTAGACHAASALTIVAQDPSPLSPPPRSTGTYAQRHAGGPSPETVPTPQGIHRGRRRMSLSQEASGKAGPVAQKKYDGALRKTFSDFYRRGEVWEQQCAKRMEELQRQREANEMAACSFYPAVSSTANLLRPAGEASLVGASPDAATPVKQPAPYQRPSSSRARWALEAEIYRQKREEADMRECTFQPNLDRRSRQSLRPSYSSPSLSSRLETRTASSFCSYNSGCSAETTQSFAPQTNCVPVNFVNARAYLQENVFTRLTQQKCGGDDSSFDGGDGAAIGGMTPVNRSRSEAHASDAGSNDAVVERFIERQQHFEEERRAHLGSLELAASQPQDPVLCVRSRRLAELARRRQGRTDARAEANSTDECGSECTGDGPPDTVTELRSAAEAMKAAYLHRDDAGLRKIGLPASKSTAKQASRHGQRQQIPSFTPKITPLAKKLDPRGFEALSTGDAKRREGRVEKMREEQRKKGEVEYSFQPKTRDYHGVPSRLRILTEPDTYIERVQSEKQADLKKYQELANAKLQREEAGNTFAPHVTAVPDFLRRMSEAYRVARQTRAIDEDLQQPHSRPDWQ